MKTRRERAPHHLVFYLPRRLDPGREGTSPCTNVASVGKFSTGVRALATTWHLGLVDQSASSSCLANDGQTAQFEKDEVLAQSEQQFEPRLFQVAQLFATPARVGRRELTLISGERDASPC